MLKDDEVEDKKNKNNTIFSKATKLFVIIAANILLIVIVFIILDWMVLAKNIYKVYPMKTQDLTTPSEREEIDLPYDTKLRPIIIGGCSFAYGACIQDDETFAYFLQKASHRKTYNISYPAQGIQHMLYRLQNSAVFKKDINPEYFIYVFIDDHIRRFYIDYIDLSSPEVYFRPKIRNGKIIMPSLEKLEHVSLVNRIQNTYLAKRLTDLRIIATSSDKKFNLLKLYLTECKKELEKHYPETKFVIIRYPYIDNFHTSNRFYSNRWQELEEEGFIIINFDDSQYDYLKRSEYIERDTSHPSGRAWAELTPIIMQKLNIENFENQQR